MFPSVEIKFVLDSSVVLSLGTYNYYFECNCTSSCYLVFRLCTEKFPTHAPITADHEKVNMKLIFYGAWSDTEFSGILLQAECKIA